VQRINKSQKDRFLQSVRDALWVLREKKIAVWGLTFKPDTDDLRSSVAIDLIAEMLREGAHVSVYDPKGMEKAREMKEIAGATFANRNDCTPKMPVAVLEIHGTSDDAVLFAGGTLTVGAVNSMAPYPGAETSIATWAKYDGCLSKSAVDEHVDVDSNLGTNAGPAEAIVMRWSGCKPGGAAELWTIPAGSHSPDLSDAFPGDVLDFLEAHPKP
jgi:hypothetical protein